MTPMTKEVHETLLLALHETHMLALLVSDSALYGTVRTILAGKGYDESLTATVVNNYFTTKQRIAEARAWLESVDPSKEG